MSERDKILTACGWLADVELPLIAERIVNHSADRIAELEAMQCHIYNSGYHEGHNDTVESCYTDIFPCDMDTYHQEEVSELVEALGDKV